jgi:hypothetical protein
LTIIAIKRSVLSLTKKPTVTARNVKDWAREMPKADSSPHFSPFLEGFQRGRAL